MSTIRHYYLQTKTVKLLTLKTVGNEKENSVNYRVSNLIWTSFLHEYFGFK
jgi:hypothetical protein